MEKMFLICNAHIDPVWQWEWEEGVGAALSTFRIAAKFCEQYDALVFNHNEALLYKWIEEYEPELFSKITELVKAGRWQIMGGWFLQPDCNMPSGESILRQIGEGRRYFKEKFGKMPRIAINFDPFGHTKGLVQIMAKSGFTGYLITRPPLPHDRFVWEGFAGTEIPVLRQGSYNSVLGKAADKLDYIMEQQQAEKYGFMLWGVGNHGGGPSKTDLENIEKIIKSGKYEAEIAHSTPEQLFDAVDFSVLPRFDRSLQPWGVGCYTSQVQVKRQHKKLENELLSAEKMASAAAAAGVMGYPKDELSAAQYDLMFSEFHDILPGSAIREVESASLRTIDHGLETLSRVKTRAFFALSRGQKPPREGELPLMVFNPHPFEVETDIIAEFMLADQYHGEGFINPTVYKDGRQLPSQCEKESSTIPINWRKRVTFRAKLEPLCCTRFDIRLQTLPERPARNKTAKNGVYAFGGGDCGYTAKLSAETGLLTSFKTDGKENILPGAGRLLVIADNFDPWGMTVSEFRKVVGEFKLATPKKAAKICGLRGEIDPIHVIEDGEVRTVMECIFVYKSSYAVIRYSFPKQGGEIGIHIRTLFLEKDKMLKLSVPTKYKKEYLGKSAFGICSQLCDGTEQVAGEYVLAAGKDRALSLINTGTHGSDFCDGEIRMSLIRTAAYCAHPLWDLEVMPRDRYCERLDEGAREFDFYLSAGPREERIASVENEAALKLQPPMPVCYFPPEYGKTPAAPLVMDNGPVTLSSLKQADDGDGFIVRLYNSCDRPQNGGFESRLCGKKRSFSDSFLPYEVKAYRITESGVAPCEIYML